MNKENGLKVSVIIPLYNKVSSIAETLKSVLSQSYTDYEIIVVNDGSTDGSEQIVAEIDDPRVRLINQANAGVSAARNRGIAETRGEYVAFLDADDEWDTDYLATTIELFTRYPECDVAASNYQFRDIKGTISPTIINRLPFEGKHGIMTNYFRVASTSHCPLWTSAVIIRKSAIESVGGFPVGVKSGEDLLTWARLACRYKIAFYTKPLATYNVGEANDFTTAPTRRQDYCDPVGQGLNQLKRTYPKTPYLSDYISHWHRMRASVAVRFGNRRETLKESLVALRYNLSNWRAAQFIVLALLPSRLRNRIIYSYK